MIVLAYFIFKAQVKKMESLRKILIVCVHQIVIPIGSTIACKHPCRVHHYQGEHHTPALG